MGQVTGMPELDEVHPKPVEGCDYPPLPIFLKSCDAMKDEVGQAESD